MAETERERKRESDRMKETDIQRENAAHLRFIFHYTMPASYCVVTNSIENSKTKEWHKGINNMLIHSHAFNGSIRDIYVVIKRKV